MNDKPNKACGRESIKKIIGPVGMVYKKSIVFVKTKENIQHHPQQYNGYGLQYPY